MQAGVHFLTPRFEFCLEAILSCLGGDGQFEGGSHLKKLQYNLLVALKHYEVKLDLCTNHYDSYWSKTSSYPSQNMFLAVRSCSPSILRPSLWVPSLQWSAWYWHRCCSSRPDQDGGPGLCWMRGDCWSGRSTSADCLREGSLEEKKTLMTLQQW